MVGGTSQTNFKARNRVFKVIETYDLTDIWRERSQSRHQYTWLSNIDTSIYCRLDYFILSKHL